MSVRFRKISIRFHRYLSAPPRTLGGRASIGGIRTIEREAFFRSKGRGRRTGSPTRKGRARGNPARSGHGGARERRARSLSRERERQIESDGATSDRPWRKREEGRPSLWFSLRLCGSASRGSGRRTRGKTTTATDDGRQPPFLKSRPELSCFLRTQGSVPHSSNRTHAPRPTIQPTACFAREPVFLSRVSDLACTARDDSKFSQGKERRTRATSIALCVTILRRNDPSANCRIDADVSRSEDPAPSHVALRSRENASKTRRLRERVDSSFRRVIGRQVSQKSFARLLRRSSDNSGFEREAAIPATSSGTYT